MHFQFLVQRIFPRQVNSALFTVSFSSHSWLYNFFATILKGFLRSEVNKQVSLLSCAVVYSSCNVRGILLLIFVPQSLSIQPQGLIHHFLAQAAACFSPGALISWWTSILQLRRWQYRLQMCRVYPFTTDPRLWVFKNSGPEISPSIAQCSHGMEGGLHTV